MIATVRMKVSRQHRVAESGPPRPVEQPSVGSPGIQPISEGGILTTFDPAWNPRPARPTPISGHEDGPPPTPSLPVRTGVPCLCGPPGSNSSSRVQTSACANISYHGINFPRNLGCPLRVLPEKVSTPECGSHPANFSG